MTYTVQFTTSAARELRKLEKREVARIAAAVRALATEPRPHGCTRLTGQPAWRVRVGDYRIIYEIDDTAVLVTVVRVGNRRDVYR